MQIKNVSFLVNLIPDTRRRHTHTRLKGNVISFVVQLEIYVKHSWLPIVRYDTAHGYAHRHIYHYRKATDTTPLFTHTYADALDFADADIKTNWEGYREHFLKEVGND